MKPASGTLLTLLASKNEYVMIETYTFTLVDGTVIVYTLGDPITDSSVSANETHGVIF